jgi:hypothetical protein
MEYKPYKYDFDQDLFYTKDDEVNPTLTPNNLRYWLLQSIEALDRTLESLRDDDVDLTFLEVERRAYQQLLDGWNPEAKTIKEKP